MTENHELITLRLPNTLSKEIDRIMKKTGFAEREKCCFTISLIEIGLNRLRGKR
jgi:metal-responsive CopG/Arc/MetJ family transcriptional regulator